MKTRKPAAPPAAESAAGRVLQVTIYPQDDANIAAIVERLKVLGHSRPRMADAVRYSLQDCASRIGSD